MSTFSSSILTLFAYIAINSKKRCFVDNFRDQMKCLYVFVKLLLHSIGSFVFLHRTLWEFCSKSQTWPILVRKLHCCRYVTVKEWWCTWEVCCFQTSRALNKWNTRFPLQGRYKLTESFKKKLKRIAYHINKTINTVIY